VHGKHNIRVKKTGEIELIGDHTKQCLKDEQKQGQGRDDSVKNAGSMNLLVGAIKKTKSFTTPRKTTQDLTHIG